MPLNNEKNIHFESVILGLGAFMNIDFSVFAQFSWWRFVLLLLCCVLGVLIWRLPEILSALS